ncbi:uncharacterized protein LOC107865439 [Capsicum annuum]|uniref:uncharacterized protein LOC107865439 n=1 Tax=Capsicum annuum TaxID=4072 RepID=UPI001FB05DFB|nr:uncharacterized protein LOC107865439 [Capsicum annuum]
MSATLNQRRTKKAISVDDVVSKERGKGPIIKQEIRPNPKPPPPFPQRLKQKREKGKFKRLIEMLKELILHIPLLEELEKMPRYSRFMKQLVTKKKGSTIEDIDGFHHCSVVTTRSLVQKKGDLGAFTILCTIGSSRFTKALCDLGASINLMSLAIFKQLGLSPPEPTAVRLLMAERTVKKPVGILFDMAMRVDSFIFLDDFVILDWENDIEMPIIFGRPFMATGIVMIGMERGELNFKVNDEEVTFNIHKSMKQPTDMRVVS